MKTERERSAKPRKRAAPAKGELVFEGLGVSPGIAVGPVHVVEGGSVHVPEYRIEPGQIEAERARFSAAVNKAQKQLLKLKAKSTNLPGTAAEEIGFLLDAHLQMLTGSRVVRGVEKLIEEGLNAEAAVQAEISKVAQDFAALDDAYLAARAQDIREVGDRLIRNLTQTPYEAFSHLTPGSIIVGEELTPADTALMNPDMVGGLAAVLGGAESHTAIMARSLGLPAVLGVAGLIGNVRSGDIVAIDGNAGRVYLNPTAKTQALLKVRHAEDEREEKQLSRLKKLPAITRDGISIGLQANLELPRELEMAVDAGAEGVGLLRTEFLYMNRDDLPDEEEQFNAYREVVEGMDGLPVTIRTFDLGADKQLKGAVRVASNPALGLRAIRLCLAEPQLFRTQLRALLRASAYGNLKILVPMLSGVSEINQTLHFIEGAKHSLANEGVAYNPNVQIGGMIEIPAAALALNVFIKKLDFLSVGTNDLIQYTLAIDRTDEEVAHLYDPLHPAVLHLLAQVIGSANKAGVPISVCGEMAGELAYTRLLLGLGLRQFSMHPAQLLGTKQRVLTTSLPEMAPLVQKILRADDPMKIRDLLDRLNAA